MVHNMRQFPPLPLIHQKDLKIFLVVTTGRYAQLIQLLSCVWLFATPWIAICQASLSIVFFFFFFFFVLSCMNCFHDLEISSWPSSTPEDCSNSCPLSWWCHLSNQLILCRPLLLSFPFFPASGSFAISQFFASRGQSIGASASVLSRNIQDWFPLGWTGWILPSKGLSRVFSNTTVQKYQFFSAQLSL